MVFAEQKKLFRWRQVRRNKKEYSICRQVVVATVVGLGATATVQAGPTGGEVTSGSATITQDGKTTDILQATQRVDINWQTFDSQVDETINFLQPNSVALAINRVLGGVPSHLEGALNANGRVFILNEAGIVFHQSATVNVAGLLATTAKDVEINDDVWNFSGTGYGSVLNYGQINVSDGGFAVLAAPYVENAGAIKADLGQIQLAGTNTFTMDLRGDGLITFSIPDDKVQQIEAEGEKLGVNNKGTLQARSGTIGMTARTASELVTGAVNLSGVVDANSFDGSMDGGKVELVSRGDINFTNTAKIQVDGGVVGDGGEVKTWADGVNNFNAGATITARGGDEAGDGGFIELSGNTVKVRGDIDASAPHGEAGTFLLDPQRINIAQGSGGSASLNVGATSATVAAASTGSTTVFEEKIETIAGGGTKVVLEAEDFIYMADLNANGGDGILDVYGGGIDLRILGNNDNDGLARIWFDNKANTIRSTTGDITIEVFGTNVSATGTAAGAEIDIGNISAGGIDIADAGNVYINAPSGDIRFRNIDVLANFNNSTASVVTDVFADLDINAGGNITAYGPITVNAELFNPSGSGGARRAFSDVNITAGGDIILTDGIQVQSLVDVDSGFIGAMRASADLDMSAIGYIDVTNAVEVSGIAQISGSALLTGLTRTQAFATINGSGGVYVDDVSVLASNLNAGNNPGGQVATADLDIIAGGTPSADIDISGYVDVTAKNFVLHAGARNEAFAYADLIAQNNIHVGGSDGISVIASGTNLQQGGFIRASADLAVTAGTNGFSGYIDISAGDVNVEANTRYEGFIKSFVNADALATLTAFNDISIEGDVRVQTFNVVEYSDGDGPGTAVGGPDGKVNASAGFVANAGTGATGSGDFYVGGLTEVIASVDKSFAGGSPPFGGSGTASAYAFADIIAGNNVTLSDGIRVNALDNVTTATGFYGATAGAFLNIDAGSAGTGNITIGNYLEVIANIQAAGTANTVAGANANATAVADIYAQDAINIGYGSSAGITVQAIANNQVTGDAPITAYASADLDVEARGNTTTIYGPVVTSASANKIDGTGDATAIADASLFDYAGISIYNGGFNTIANANIGTGASSGAALAQATGYISAGSVYGGNVYIDGDVEVAAEANNFGAFGSDADATADLAIYAGGASGSNYGGIDVNGSLFVEASANLAYASAGSITVNADANAFLIAGNDIDISGDIEVLAAALSSGTSSAPGASVDADAVLNVIAGGYVSGTSADTAVINIGGNVLVSADADQLGSDADAHGVTAYSDAYLAAANDIYIGGYLNVFANAYTDAFQLWTLGTNSQAVAGAYLTVDAGAKASSGEYGDFIINGNVVVDADAEAQEGYAVSGARARTDAFASADIDAYGDVNAGGYVAVNADAIIGSGVGYLDAISAITANADATLDIDAGSNVYIADSVTVHALASNYASANNSGATTDANASADLDINAGTISYGYIFIGDNLTVDATGKLGSALTGTSNSVDVDADARLVSNYGDITVDGNVLVSALADSRAVYATGAFASADLEMLAATGDTGSYNLNVGGTVSVLATANILGGSGTTLDNGAEATASAFAYLRAAQDVNINSNGASTDTGLNVSATVSSYGDMYNAIVGSAEALASADIQAGNGYGYGSINITGDAVVSADAEIGGYVEDFSLQEAVGARSYLTLQAPNDITIDGDIDQDARAVLAANAFSPITSANPYSVAFLDVDAGTASPSGVYAAAFGYGDFTVTGNVDVDATVTADAFYVGPSGIDPLTVADVNVNAYQDISIGGYVDVSANGFVTSNLLYGSNDLSADADADFIAGRNINISSNVSVSALASNQSNAGAYGSFPNADADAQFYMFAGANGTGYIDIGGDLAVTAEGYMGAFAGEIAEADAFAYANLAANNGYINISGNVDVNAYASVLSLYGSSAQASAYLFVDAGNGAGGYHDLIIGGDVNVSANAVVTSGTDTAVAYALADLLASNDINISYSGVGANAINVSANAINLSSISPSSLGDADATAMLDMVAGDYGTGSISVYGGVNVSANALTSGYLDGGGAEALADAYILAANDINIYGNVNVAAAAASYNLGSTFGVDATAEAYLDMIAGTSSSGSIYIAGDVVVDADAYVSANPSGQYASNAYAIANGYLTAANSITIDGNYLQVMADAVTVDGTYAKASAALYVAAGLHSSGDLFIDINSTLISADAYAGNGIVDVDASATFQAAENLSFYGDSFTLFVPAAGPYGANADASLIMVAGTHGSNGNLYLDVDNFSVGADAAVGYSGDAFANANAYLVAATDVTFRGDYLTVFAGATTPSGQADATADLYMGAGLHSSGNLLVDINNDVLVSADAVSYGTIGFNTNTAQAFAEFRAADDVSFYSDTLTVQAFAAHEGVGNSASIFANADLYMGAGTHNSAGNLWVDVTDTLVLADAYQGGGSPVAINATADAAFRAANDVSVYGTTLSVLANAEQQGVNTNSVGAIANLYMGAGTHSSGALFVDVTDTLVQADAFQYGGNGFTINADANAEFRAADNVSFYGNTLSVLGNARWQGSNSNANFAFADLYMGAGTHGSTGNLYVAVTDTLVQAVAYQSGDFAGTFAGMFAAADAEFRAANDVSFSGYSLSVIANAERQGTNGIFASANADLSMAAGTHSVSGDLYVDITNTLVSADALLTSGFATANASADLVAFDNITFNGTRLTVLSEADTFSGVASATATLYMGAGTGSSGNLSVNNTYTTVSADAFGENTADAEATAEFRAANNVEFYGEDVYVGAFAEATDFVADANADLIFAAGTHGTAGNMYVAVTNTLVTADASANTDARADANMDLRAYNNITFQGEYLTVLAEADSLANNALAFATLYMGAGTGSSGNLSVTNTYTTVSADASGIGSANAGATAEFRAANNVEFYGEDVYVGAFVNSFDSDASANADLIFAAGTHGTAGDLYVAITNTLVTADAAASFEADANANMDLRAYNNITFQGEYLTVLAAAESSIDTAIADATLYMGAGTGSSGNLSVNNTYTTISADVYAEDFAVADATAEFRAANNIEFYGETLTVLSTAVSANSDATASADLILAAGTHSNGSLYAVIPEILVSAYADARDSAFADAYAGFTAANDVSLYADNLTVDGYAFANFADAAATLYMAAGTHLDFGDLYVNVADTSRVFASATALGANTANATAIVDMQAYNDITFLGENLFVQAIAPAFVNATATASVNMDAGQLSSNAQYGDLYVAINNILVSASASTATTNNIANAYLGMTAANDVSVYSDFITVQAFADAFDISAIADARYNIRAGTHQNYGSIYFNVTDTTLVFASADNALFGTATAIVDMQAYNDITINNPYMTVQAFSDAGSTAFATASVYMAAGTSSNGSLSVNVTDLLVSADADAGFNADATARAEFRAANNVEFYGEDVYVAAFAGGFPSTTADASANLIMAAGTHSVSGDLYVDITDTLVDAQANADDFAFAYAHTTLTAYNNITFLGDNLTVTADADVPSGDVFASATLYMGAGTGSSGDLYVNVGDTLVSADASIDGSTGSAVANAYGEFRAANNITFIGDTLTVTGDASGGTNNFVDVSLYMGAGSHSNGSMTVNLGDLLVTADVYLVGTGTASAVADIEFRAADNLSFTANTVTVQAEADKIGNVGNATAIADLYMGAGTHNSSGNLYVDIFNTLVSADAYMDGNSGTANAGAYAAFRAAEDIEFEGDTVYVLAGSEKLGASGIASATADLYMGAGTHSNGSLYVSVTDTLVSANAYIENGVQGFGIALARAETEYRAADDVTVYGSTLKVLAGADKLGDNGNATATADLYMGAGTHDSSGNLYVDVTNTLVSADAYMVGEGGNAGATAYAEIRAAEEIDFQGDSVYVLAGANKLGDFGNASAVADLYMGAGTHSSGGLYVDIFNTLVSADANMVGDGGNAEATAYAAFRAADDVEFVGDEMTVLAGANKLGDLGNANATADLYMGAGTHDSSGNLYVDITNTLVSADANMSGVFGSANANASAAFRAAEDIDFQGDSVYVLAGANKLGDLGNASALADLSMGAGTHSSGALYVDITDTLVLADAYHGGNFASTVFANADAEFTAADDVYVQGSTLNVLAYAEQAGSGTGFIGASATLDIAAGTHNSNGNLYVTVTDTLVLADAYQGGNSADTIFASADAEFTAADDIYVQGSTLNVLAYAEQAGSYAGSIFAGASLVMEAGRFDSNGNLSVNVTDTLVLADAYQGGNSADTIFASADAEFTAANNVYLTGSTLGVLAYAEQAGSSASFIGASASLDVDAGDDNVYGSLFMTVTDTLVLADVYQAGNFGFLFASADANFEAANDVYLTGSTLDILAFAEQAGSDAGFVGASANLDVDAGDDNDYGSLFMDVTDTLVLADAYQGGGSAGSIFADAEVDIEAANDVYLTGSTLDVLAYAAQAGSDANSVRASAEIEVDAGDDNDYGSLFMDVTDTLVLADAYQGGSGVGAIIADAEVDLEAANDVYLTGSTLDVLAYAAQAGSFASFIIRASAEIEIDAGDDNDYGSLFMDVTDTLVLADAYQGGGSASAIIADAEVDLEAANDVYLTGSTLDVLAYAAQAGSFASFIGAFAEIEVDAGDDNDYGSLFMDVTDTLVLADAYQGGGGGGFIFASAEVDIDDAGNNVYLTGSTLGVLAYAAQAGSDGFIGASAEIDIEAGDDNVYGGVFMDVTDTLVLADAYQSGGGAGSIFADAEVDIEAANDVYLTGSTLDVLAYAAQAGSGTGFIGAFAEIEIDAGEDNDYGSVFMDVTDTLVLADAYQGGNNGFVFASASADIAAANNSDIDGDINISATGFGNGTAMALANGLFSNSGDIDVNGTVNVDADATNSFGPAGGGDANALASFMATASGTVTMDAISVNADALCSGSSGPCDAIAGATGFVGAGGDISISGPINVQSVAINNNTGTTASATADLDIVGSGNINVGTINVLASAVNTNHGNAFASADGLISAAGSNTVSDISINANASASGSAAGFGYLLVQTGTGDNTLNGGLSVNVGLTGASTSGYAQLELDAAGSAGSNIAGIGFAVPTATAGGASVTNTVSDIDTVGNATAELVIPHEIVLDNELTRRMVITYMETTGFVLPTSFPDSDSIGPGNGATTGGGTGADIVILRNTYRSRLLTLPNGGGFGGFGVDDNGNVIFRAAMGGLPDLADLPIPEVCDLPDDRPGRAVPGGGVLNCPWDDQEPTFY